MFVAVHFIYRFFFLLYLFNDLPNGIRSYDISFWFFSFFPPSHIEYTDNV